MEIVSSGLYYIKRKYNRVKQCVIPETDGNY